MGNKCSRLQLSFPIEETCDEDSQVLSFMVEYLVDDPIYGPLLHHIEDGVLCLPRPDETPPPRTFLHLSPHAMIVPEAVPYTQEELDILTHPSRYRRIETLGFGRFAKAILCEDVLSNSQVVLKFYEKSRPQRRLLAPPADVHNNTPTSSSETAISTTATTSSCILCSPMQAIIGLLPAPLAPLFYHHLRGRDTPFARAADDSNHHVYQELCAAQRLADVDNVLAQAYAAALQGALTHTHDASCRMPSPTPSGHGPEGHLPEHSRGASAAVESPVATAVALLFARAALSRLCAPVEAMETDEFVITRSEVAGSVAAQWLPREERFSVSTCARATLQRAAARVSAVGGRVPSVRLPEHSADAPAAGGADGPDGPDGPDTSPAHAAAVCVTAAQTSVEDACARVRLLCAGAQRLAQGRAGVNPLQGRASRFDSDSDSDSDSDDGGSRGMNGGSGGRPSLAPVRASAAAGSQSPPAPAHVTDAMLQRLLRDAAAAACALQVCGAAHRDVKPANVCVWRGGMRLIDWSEAALAPAGDSCDCTAVGEVGATARAAGRVGAQLRPRSTPSRWLPAHLLVRHSAGTAAFAAPEVCCEEWNDWRAAGQGGRGDAAEAGRGEGGRGRQGVGVGAAEGELWRDGSAVGVGEVDWEGEEEEDESLFDCYSDAIYALGATLYCLVTARLPFHAYAHAQQPQWVPHSHYTRLFERLPRDGHLHGDHTPVEQLPRAEPCPALSPLAAPVAYDSAVYGLIAERELSWPAECSLSVEGRHALGLMLEKRVSARATWVDIITHPFLRARADE